jgi:hypothetical protein
VLRSRHVHGDEQILQLYDMTRSFATSYDDTTTWRSHRRCSARSQRER